MKLANIIPLAFLAAAASASQLSTQRTTCQEACYTKKPECKSGMFLQSADGACWFCCMSNEKFCLQVCFDEPPTCDDGSAPTKNGECYTCCRAPHLPTKTKVEPSPALTFTTRSFEVCDRQCDSEPPTCGNWVPFQPGGRPCWACCDPDSLPSIDPEIAGEPELEPKPLTPKTCDRSCFDEPQEYGEGMVSWSEDNICWSCCDHPAIEQK